MGYYMRFVSTDPRPVTPEELRDALLAADPGYEIAVDDSVVAIRHSGATIAQVEINLPGDGLFEQERDELVAFATDAAGDGFAKVRILETLRGVRTIVAAQLLFGAGDNETTLRRLDPLWASLFRNHEGLLQADGEGYYDTRGIVFPVD